MARRLQKFYSHIVGSDEINILVALNRPRRSSLGLAGGVETQRSGFGENLGYVLDDECRVTGSDVSVIRIDPIARSAAILKQFNDCTTPTGSHEVLDHLSPGISRDGINPGARPHV